MTVDPQRKCAYRWLIYHAMLNIRPLGWTKIGWRQRLNPKAWLEYSQQVKLAGEVADWLHNLALFSAFDFANFDEEWFWRSFQLLSDRNPNVNFHLYRDEFDRWAKE